MTVTKTTKSHTDRRAHALIVRLRFQPSVRRSRRSIFVRRLHAQMNAIGVITTTSRNWAVCVPLDQSDLLQVRVAMTLWLIEQGELLALEVFLPAQTIDLLRQRHPLVEEGRRWPVIRRDVALSDAAPLLSTLCGHALSRAVLAKEV